MMRVNQKLLPVRDADLVENAREMMTYRTVRNGQPVCDVFIRKSLTYQSDHFSFTFSQCVGPHSRLDLSIGICIGDFLRIHDSHSISFDNGVVMNRGIERVNRREHNLGRLNFQDHTIDSAIHSLACTLLILVSA